MIWYHGTSSEFGIARGDICDPARSEEGAFFATSDLAVARNYAAMAVAEHGGQPVVWVVELLDHAEELDVLVVDELPSDLRRVIEYAVIGNNISGEPCLAVTADGVAEFARQV